MGPSVTTDLSNKKISISIELSSNDLCPKKHKEYQKKSLVSQCKMGIYGSI